MTVEDEKEGVVARGDGLRAMLAAGGVLAALGVSSCCILPLVLFTLGISGAWIGNFTALAPYQPIFLGAAVVFLVAGFWRVYRQPKVGGACVADDRCARPASNVTAKVALWAATALVALALVFPHVAPLFFATS